MTSSGLSSEWEPSKFRQYPIPLDEIPRLHVDDPDVGRYIAQSVKGLLLNCSFI